MRLTFQVSLTVPEEAGINYTRDYIREAVQAWGGQKHPDDPLFSSRIHRVTVVRKREKKD